MNALVIGGYGGFGGRLSLRLVEAGHQVWVGGRSLARAQSFCMRHPECRPVEIDRNGDIAEVLKRVRPDVVIDAAGPFQSSSNAVAESCIAAKTSYLDLADDRAFVEDIARLDLEARAAGVSVISGASSVPALSHAVVAELADSLDTISAIEISISASSRAAAGRSVMRAILSGAGKPLRQWRGGRWETGYGWHELRSERMALPTGETIGRRLLALVDVPDLALLPARYPDVSAVSFRAGTESRLGVVALWLLAWLVRSGLARTLLPLHRMLSALHRATALWGSDRSGMLVRVFGVSDGRRFERCWTLIARDGDGPEIPVLPAALLVDRLASGNLPPGARHAGGSLTLRDFDAALVSLSVETAIEESMCPAPLYERVMGNAFAKLARPIQAMHDVHRDKGASGRATVTGSPSLAARAIRHLMRFPPLGEHALQVHFAERGGVERWTRDFAGAHFSSALRQGREGESIEQFGPLHFHFQLIADPQGQLKMRLTRWTLGAVPLPLGLAPRVSAHEWDKGDLFHFDVPIDLPLIGRLIRYRGWLKPIQAGSDQNGTSSSRSVSNAAG